jgi:type IV secretion system protein VirB8
MKIRRTKQEVIDRERELAATTSIDAATAKNISLAEQAYVHAARWFESNVAEGHQRKARMWKRLAITFGVLAFMAVGAVLGLTPLKTVETYLVRVDNTSGFTDVVPPVSQAKTPERIDDEYWLSTYVRFRESYNFSSNDANYAMVKLMSYDETFESYKTFQLSSKGYLAVLGTNRQIRTDINNIDLLPREIPDPASESKGIKTYQVRMTKTVLDKNGMPDQQIRPSTWTAMVSFDYRNPTTRSGDQWRNPRGFGVLAYSTNLEVGVSRGN